MNGYLQRQSAQTQAYIQATCDIYSQWVHDHACLVLHEFVPGMGGDRFYCKCPVCGEKCWTHDRSEGGK